METSEWTILQFYIPKNPIVQHNNINKMKLSFALSALVAAKAAAFMPNTATGVQTSMAAISGSKGTGEGWIDPSAPVNSEKSLKLTLDKCLEGSTFQKRLSLLGSTGASVYTIEPLHKITQGII